MLVGGCQVGKDLLGPVALVQCDLGEPDGGFDGFDLAEERLYAGERVTPPVLEQAGGFGGDVPLVRIGQLPPLIYILADFVDDGVGVVLLLGGGNVLRLGEKNFGLFFGIGAAALLRLGDGGDEGRTAAGLGDVVGGLAVSVELPVAAGIGVGRVEDRLLEKVARHRCWKGGVPGSEPGGAVTASGVRGGAPKGTLYGPKTVQLCRP